MKYVLINRLETFPLQEKEQPSLFLLNEPFLSMLVVAILILLIVEI